MSSIAGVCELFGVAEADCAIAAEEAAIAFKTIKNSKADFIFTLPLQHFGVVVVNHKFFEICGLRFAE